MCLPEPSKRLREGEVENMRNSTIAAAEVPPLSVVLLARMEVRQGVQAGRPTPVLLHEKDLVTLQQVLPADRSHQHSVMRGDNQLGVSRVRRLVPEQPQQLCR